MISSTEIRNRVCANRFSPPFFGVSGLVTPKVIDYIGKNRLYITPAGEVDLNIYAESPLIIRENSTASNASNSGGGSAAVQNDST